MNSSVSGLIAFDGSQCIACGEAAAVVLKAKETYEARPLARILVFDAVTSEQLDFDYSQAPEQLLRWLSSMTDKTRSSVEPDSTERPANVGPGRPRLGVVAREVTLLPSHWQWLSTQPGGASVALRKLVEQAKRSSTSVDRRRLAQEASYRFMSVMAGNLAGFEEAARALFAADQTSFDTLIGAWPVDVLAHLKQLSIPVFDEGQGEPHHV